jgi:hypothetical protein
MAARSAAGGRAAAERPTLPRPQKPSGRFPEFRDDRRKRETHKKGARTFDPNPFVSGLCARCVLFGFLRFSLGY